MNMVQRSYKYRFHPTPEQSEQLAVEFGCSRWVWNHALDMRQKAYQRRKEAMNYVPLNRHINILKKTSCFDWIKSATSAVLTQKLIDLDAAYTNFFRGRVGFPQFKKKSHRQSVRYRLDQRQIHRIWRPGVLRLPKLGAIDIKWSQTPTGVPKMITVTKTATGKYFVSFSVEEDVNALPKTGLSVGLDMGIKNVIVTSDGWFSGAPKFTYLNEKRLRKAQRDLSRKTKGSNRWHKQRVVVARIHEAIKNCRNDFLQKMTTCLIREYDHIYIEDLNVSGMVKNRHLAKAISDVGMFEIKRQLEYKASWYGKAVSKISRWYPSSKTCSSCGATHDMPLSKRLMDCECGLKLDRDLNAAINIKQAGIVWRGELNPGATTLVVA